MQNGGSTRRRRDYRRTWQQHILNLVGYLMGVHIRAQGANLGKIPGHDHIIW